MSNHNFLTALKRRLFPHIAVIENLRQEIERMRQDAAQMQQTTNNIKQKLQQAVAQEEQAQQELTIAKKLLTDAQQHNEQERIQRQQQANTAEQELAKAKKQLKQQQNELCDQIAANELQLQVAQQTEEQLKNKLADIELRQELMTRLLAANNTNQGVADYFQTLNGDFLNFANQENVLEDAAAALLELQAIGEELKIIGAFPDFYKKRTIAIAGGFSAGKTNFINSLFADSNLRLPVSLKPTTAMPTYVLHGKKNGLIGCNTQGGTVDLLKIAPDFQNKLSHGFIQSFRFNLKSIMPFVFMTTPMPYENLCFIDTPGHNAPDKSGGYTAVDRITALESAQNAEAILWLIGLDSNGTIPQSDLGFLERAISSQNKPLYIVLNKADRRTSDDWKDVLNEAREILDDYDITYEGISVYSANKHNEYTYHKQSLIEFLTGQNYPSDKHYQMLERLYSVKEQCQRTILYKIKTHENISKSLKTLCFDLLQAGHDDISSNLYTTINKIATQLPTVQNTTHLYKLENITQKLANAIDCVFGQKINFQPRSAELNDLKKRLR